MLDRSGIASFIIITFAVTYSIEGALIAAGFRVSQIPPLFGQLVLAAVMWVPAIATVLTVRFVTREGFGVTNLRIGPLRPYLTSALVVPACFAVTYALTWLLGLGQPDWQLSEFRSLMASTGADTSTMPPSTLIIPLLFLVSLFIYPGYPVTGMIAMVALTTAIGVYINELTLRNRSSILAGWVHGAINGQAYGIWRLLFPWTDPLLGGMTGLVGIAVNADPP